MKSPILIFVGAYTPAYRAGGPIRSIENLVKVLGEEFHFRIVTQDRDLGQEAPMPGVISNRWVRVGNADVMYLGSGIQGFLGMWRILRSVDRNTVLYLNSFFARSYSMFPLLLRGLGLCRPRCLVLAPRGEFSPGALQLKPKRKQVYTAVWRLLSMGQNILWHASTPFEAADISRQFPSLPHVDVAGILTEQDRNRPRTLSSIATASDIGDDRSEIESERGIKKPGRLRAIFLSRLSRKKNLAYALKLLAGVTGEVEFRIYGPKEDLGYWEECEGLISLLPQNVRVRYEGEIEHSQVEQVFARHDLFLFPTRGENYGHVICEALMAGCPVLISDQTPWRDLESRGVGWDVALEEPDAFRAALQKCIDLDGPEFQALSRRAREYAIERTCDPAVVEANRALFRSALSWPTTG